MRLALTAATLGLCLTLAPSAFANPKPRLAEAQAAYAEVDYERTRVLASAALNGGDNDRATTAELYLLLATASAALDQSDEARAAFARALSANPELKLERSLSPKIRGPYLEVRGAMANADNRAPLEVTLEQRRGGLELKLRDVLHVAVSITLATRSPDGGAFQRQALKPIERQRVPVSGGDTLEYAIQVRDEHQNVLLEVGSDEEPARLITVSEPSRRSLVNRTAQVRPGPNRSTTGYYVASVALGALAVGAGAGATVMYLKREDAAQEWNGPACERTGLTREQQCSPVDDRRRRSEYWSIGLAATGGALLLGSLVTLILAPPSASEPQLTVDAGPNNVVLGLQARL